MTLLQSFMLGFCCGGVLVFCYTVSRLRAVSRSYNDETLDNYWKDKSGR